MLQCNAGSLRHCFLGVADERLGIRGSTPTQMTMAEQLEACERVIVIAEVRRHNGVMARTAKALGMGRNTLFYKIKR